jgi:hypothetical protein
MEAPTPAFVPEKRTTIQTAIAHFLKLKESKSQDTGRKNKRVLTSFKSFMEATPRNYEFVTEVKFPDLTDFCSAWKGSNRSKTRDLGILTLFLKYCHRADFTSKNIGEGLFKTLNWPDDEGPKDPFSDSELESIWKVLPSYPDEYGRFTATDSEAD